MEHQVSKPICEGFVFTRKLLIEQGGVHTDARLKGLLSLAGMVSVEIKQDERLVMRYDASQLQIDAIVGFLDKRGIRLRKGLWQNFCVSWYRFTDNNTVDNAKLTEPHCCNKPPKGF